MSEKREREDFIRCFPWTGKAFSCPLYAPLTAGADLVNMHKLKEGNLARTRRKKSKLCKGAPWQERRQAFTFTGSHPFSHKRHKLCSRRSFKINDHITGIKSWSCDLNPAMHGCGYWCLWANDLNFINHLCRWLNTHKTKQWMSVCSYFHIKCSTELRRVKQELLMKHPLVLLSPGASDVRKHHSLALGWKWAFCVRSLLPLPAGGHVFDPVCYWFYGCIF